jgi:hypothetical protein
MGAGDCNFTINNDDPSTNSTAVTLITECPVAPDGMIISNSAVELQSAIDKGKRDLFQSSMSWTLDGIVDPGTQTVYAAFYDGKVVQTSDDIYLDTL